MWVCWPEEDCVLQISALQFCDSLRTAGKNIDQFLTWPQTLASSCKFPEPDNKIRDKIVFSTEDLALKELLLPELKLSLEKAADISWSSELAHKELIGTKGAKGLDKQEVDTLVTTCTNKPRLLRGGQQVQSLGPGMAADEIIAVDAEQHMQNE